MLSGTSLSDMRSVCRRVVSTVVLFQFVLVGMLMFIAVVECPICNSTSFKYDGTLPADRFKKMLRLTPLHPTAAWNFACSIGSLVSFSRLALHTALYRVDATVPRNAAHCIVILCPHESSRSRL